ncbi:hypothetical protein CH272_18745 [Rhodococcus sp. 05-340-1]|uniref:hypothetical protein n=1 Tax=Nocardiaceae TaxID=85025 RepID=UPI00050BE8A9|nr:MULTISPECIES: hypothetical protein [Rhodococcus]OZC87694.1 hypothetical protein CH254_14055 [Rhodococcus sp. 06-412-2C]OZC96345.1 hypothetical protein CH279_14225 [Rhodococcus sp. 06-412-2B]OZD65328.1 hypothetical protein CH271_20045 [Rhodococcus sp. 05-340-2]OZD74625.1 hypothetical protein CH272_18745 [Rhodococcus sp. 05-340-1]OZD86601.1 hypothetical protein CH273_00280 [Rhodococcus sp. 05-339-2]
MEHPARSWDTPPPAQIAVGTELTHKLEIANIADAIVFRTERLEPPRSLGVLGSGRRGHVLERVLSEGRFVGFADSAAVVRLGGLREVS